MLPSTKGLTREHGAHWEMDPYAAQMGCPLAPHVTQAEGRGGARGGASLIRLCRGLLLRRCRGAAC